MTHPLNKKLFEIIDSKKTNLAFALDVTTKSDFLRLADLIGPEICVLKTHVDIIRDFDQDLITQLLALSKKHNFLIFEDRKFADIGEIANFQFGQGIYEISKWADIVNAHGFPGPGIIEGLKAQARPGTGLLLLAQMSSKNNLFSPEITERIVEMAEQHSDYVMGFISQKKLPSQKKFIHMTPGVDLDKTGDVFSQQYRTPKEVIVNQGVDVIIVGSGIYKATDPLAAAKRYKAAGWTALNEWRQLNMN